jgi:hypothetical protein
MQVLWLPGTAQVRGGNAANVGGGAGAGAAAAQPVAAAPGKRGRAARARRALDLTASDGDSSKGTPSPGPLRSPVSPLGQARRSASPAQPPQQAPQQPQDPPLLLQQPQQQPEVPPLPPQQQPAQQQPHHALQQLPAPPQPPDEGIVGVKGDWVSWRHALAIACETTAVRLRMRVHIGAHEISASYDMVIVHDAATGYFHASFERHGAWHTIRDTDRRCRSRIQLLTENGGIATSRGTLEAVLAAENATLFTDKRFPVDTLEHL